MLALDRRCHQILASLQDPFLHVITLEEVETPELFQARSERSWGEYCWTLKPFLPRFVFERDSSVDTVVYIDSDCWLPSPVAPLLHRFESTTAACMLTPHAFSAHRDATAIAGVFCAQFMPFRRRNDAFKILRWWQERCLEHCSSKPGQGPLGDQGYLTDWPERFGDSVFVLDQPSLTLAPWNIERFWRSATRLPCLFHFQGFRLFRLGGFLVIRASAGVPLQRSAVTHLHSPYLADILAMLARLPPGSLAPRPVPSLSQDLRGALLFLPRLLVLHWVVWFRPLPAALRGAAEH